MAVGYTLENFDVGFKSAMLQRERYAEDQLGGFIGM
jgi:hypothetical protein